MIHFTTNNKVASSAVYSIEDYNHEIANKKRTTNSSNLLLAGIIIFGLCGLYLSLGGA
jgi:hypothetical protein